MYKRLGHNKVSIQKAEHLIIYTSVVYFRSGIYAQTLSIFTLVRILLSQASSFVSFITQTIYFLFPIYSVYLQSPLHQILAICSYHGYSHRYPVVFGID